MKQSETILPLKLVDFEHYMLADDAHAYPMTIPMILRFDGLLDANRLEQALVQTAEENPLLRAKVDEIGGQRYWVEGSVPKIQRVDQFPTIEKIDLYRENGIRVYLQELDGKSTIKVFVHHSVTDGGGILHFVERWFVHYLALNRCPDSQDRNAFPDEFDLEKSKQQLLRRGNYGMKPWKYLLRPVQEFCGAVGIFDFFWHRPAAIGPQSSAEMPAVKDDAAEFSHRHHTFPFTPEESRAIVQASRESGYSVNDLLVTAKFDACYRWLAEHRPDDAHRFLRIMVPMDMRNRKAPERYVANNVSMVFLDRRPGRYRSVRGLAWLVWLEMVTIKAMKLGLSFGHLIRFYRRRNKLNQLMRTDRSIATTILSNMGILFSGSPLCSADRQLVVEDIRLSEISVFPPIRPFTWLTSVVYSYGNRLTVNLSWCSKSLSQEDVDQVLGRFRELLTDDLAGWTSKQK